MVGENFFGVRRWLSYWLDLVVLAALLSIVPGKDRFGIGYWVDFLVPSLYFLGFAILGGTPGKVLVGLRLRRFDGLRPDLKDAFHRYWAFVLIMGLAVVLDPLWPKARLTGINLVGALFVFELLTRKAGQLPRDRFSATSYWRTNRKPQISNSSHT